MCKKRNPTLREENADRYARSCRTGACVVAYAKKLHWRDEVVFLHWQRSSSAEICSLLQPFHRHWTLDSHGSSAQSLQEKLSKLVEQKNLLDEQKKFLQTFAPLLLIRRPSSRTLRSIVISGKHDVRSQKDPSSDDNRHRAWGVATLGRSYDNSTKTGILDTIGSPLLAFPCDLGSAKSDCRSHRQGSRKTTRMTGGKMFASVFIYSGERARRGLKCAGCCGNTW